MELLHWCALLCLHLVHLQLPVHPLQLFPCRSAGQGWRQTQGRAKCSSGVKFQLLQAARPGALSAAAHRGTQCGGVDPFPSSALPASPPSWKWPSAWAAQEAPCWILTGSLLAHLKEGKAALLKAIPKLCSLVGSQAAFSSTYGLYLLKLPFCASHALPLRGQEQCLAAQDCFPYRSPIVFYLLVLQTLSLKEERTSAQSVAERSAELCVLKHARCVPAVLRWAAGGTEPQHRPWGGLWEKEVHACACRCLPVCS